MANKLLFETGIDGTGFSRGLSMLAAQGASHFKNFVAGAFGIYSIQQALHNTMEAADELVTASERLDVGVEQLQIMRQAAKEVRLEFGLLERAMEAINVARTRALGGDKKAMAAFAQMGVSTADLKTKTAADIMHGPMGDVAKLKNVTDFSEALREIMPNVRNFGEVTAYLRSHFEETGVKLKRMGILMDTETAVALDRLGDELSVLSRVLLPFMGRAILSFTSAMMNAAEAYLGWIDRRMGVGPPGSTKSEGPGFFSKTGHGLLGLGSGLATIVNTMAGLDALAEQSASFANEQFDKSFEFMSGGPLRAMGDKIAKDAEKGGGGLQKSLADWRQQFNDAVEAESKRLRNQPELNPTALLEDEKKIKAEKNLKDSTDALVGVGNFLGSSQGIINSIPAMQLQVAQQHLTVAQGSLNILGEVKKVLETINNGISDADLKRMEMQDSYPE